MEIPSSVPLSTSCSWKKAVRRPESLYMDVPHTGCLDKLCAFLSAWSPVAPAGITLVQSGGSSPLSPFCQLSMVPFRLERSLITISPSATSEWSHDACQTWVRAPKSTALSTSTCAVFCPRFLALTLTDGSVSSCCIYSGRLLSCSTLPLRLTHWVCVM